MHRYIIKRLLYMIFVLFGITFMIYFAMDLAPGDEAMSMLGSEFDQEEYEKLREELGLNRPVIVRYAEYMGKLLQGDLGNSSSFKKPVAELYAQRLPRTLCLGVASWLLGLFLGLPMGIYSALKQGKWQDNVTGVIAMFGLAAPNFWVGLMLIIIFSLNLGWFNSGGLATPADLVLPAITAGTDGAAGTCRVTRSALIDTLRQDYLMLARAKGVSERKVIRKHALRNAMIPIITNIGGGFAGAFSGAVITETVFNINGVGRMMVTAMKANDVNTVTGCIIITSTICSLVRLGVDIMYAFLDPRIKAQYSK